MNDTVADNNVLRPDLRPLLTAELGEQTGADGAVVALFLTRWRALCGPDRADNVCSADNPDDLALAHDRNALDPFCLQQRRDFTKVGVLSNGYHIARHDVLHRAAM